jgi:hypothetical protein
MPIVRVRREAMAAEGCRQPLQPVMAVRAPEMHVIAGAERAWFDGGLLPDQLHRRNMEPVRCGVLDKIAVATFWRRIRFLRRGRVGKRRSPREDYPAG